MSATPEIAVPDDGLLPVKILFERSPDFWVAELKNGKLAWKNGDHGVTLHDSLDDLPFTWIDPIKFVACDRPQTEAVRFMEALQWSAVTGKPVVDAPCFSQAPV